MNGITRYVRYARATVFFVAPIVTLLALGIVLNITTPLESGPLIILVVLLLLYAFICSLLAAVLHSVTTILHAMRPKNRFSARRGYYVVSVISLAPVLFIALNTLDQLDPLEIILIILLVSLGCFYTLRRTAK